jgi:hypothetical protein
MVCEHPRPRYSGQMENGVLYFVAPCKAHGKRDGIRTGDKSRQFTINSEAKNHIK